MTNTIDGPFQSGPKNAMAPRGQELDRLREKLIEMQAEITRLRGENLELGLRYKHACYSALFMYPFFDTARNAYVARHADFRRIFEAGEHFSVCERLMSSLSRCDQDQYDFLSHLTEVTKDRASAIASQLHHLSVCSSEQLDEYSSFVVNTGLLGFRSAFPGNYGVSFVGGDSLTFSGMARKDFVFLLEKAIGATAVVSADGPDSSNQDGIADAVGGVDGSASGGVYENL